MFTRFARAQAFAWECGFGSPSFPKDGKLGIGKQLEPESIESDPNTATVKIKHTNQSIKHASFLGTVSKGNGFGRRLTALG